MFGVFFDFWSSAFKHSFLLSSGTDFPWILAPFRHNFYRVFQPIHIGIFLVESGRGILISSECSNTFVL